VPTARKTRNGDAARPIVRSFNQTERCRARAIDRGGLRAVGDEREHVAAQPAGIRRNHAQHGLRGDRSIDRRATRKQGRLPGRHRERVGRRNGAAIAAQDRPHGRRKALLEKPRHRAHRQTAV
jgi:hypothetical protein